MPNDIKFKGFEPTSELRSLAKELLWYLEGRSPSQSSAQAVLSKEARSYQGVLEIFSNQGVFKAVASSLHPEECLQDLYKKALSLVRDWAFSRKSSTDF
jgi:hypothetical protein